MNTDDGSPETIAQWMLDKVEQDGVLTQYEAATTIQEQFGDEFVYLNSNDHLAIRPDVLKAFRELRDDNVEWNSGEKVWTYKSGADEILLTTEDYSDLNPVIDPALLENSGIDTLLQDSEDEINKLLTASSFSIEDLQ